MSNDAESVHPKPRRKKRKQTQLLKLSREARIAVWIIIGLLAVVLIIEWHASHGYNSTLARFQQRIVESETGSAFTLFEVRTTVSGFPSESTVEESGRKVLFFSWFSLFRHYQIGLTLAADEQVVVAMRTGAVAPVDLQERSDRQNIARNESDSKSKKESTRSSKNSKKKKKRKTQSLSSSPIVRPLKVPTKEDIAVDNSFVVAVRDKLLSTSSTPVFKSNEGLLTESTRLSNWLSTGILPSYEKFGDKNSEWDQSARKFLQQWWVARQGRFPAESRPELLTSGDQLTQRGCNDPLIMYAYGESLASDGTNASGRKAMNLVRDAIARFENSQYPISVSVDANLLYAKLAEDYMNWRPSVVDAYLVSIADRLIQAITANEFLSGEQRVLTKKFMSLLDRELEFQRSEVMAKVFARKDLNKWFAKLLRAREHLRVGWQKRASALDVGDKDIESTEFYAHWARARVLLLELWYQHPEHPEPAIDLIEVCSILGGIADETPRFWFDEAVRRQFDEMTAYDAFLDTMSPRRGGTQEKMIEFGRNCLATKRFDTLVPMQFHYAVQDISSQSDDPNAIYHQKGIYDDYDQLLNSYADNAKIESESQFRKSQLACAAYLAGKQSVSARLLRILGGDADSDAFLTFGIELEDVQGELTKPSTTENSLSGHRGSISGIGFLDNEATLVTAGVDGTVRFWSPVSESQQGVLKTNTGAITAMAIAPDETRFATADSKGSVSFWKYPTNKLDFKVNHRVKVLAMSFSPDGKYFVTAGDTIGGVGEIKFWDAVYGDKLATLNVERQAIQTLAFSNDGSTFVSGSGNSRRSELSAGNLILWNAKQRSQMRTFAPFPGGILSAQYSPDGQTIAVSGMTESSENSIDTNGIQLIDARSGETVHSFNGHWYEITSVAFPQDGDRLFTSSRDRTIRVWDTILGKELAVFTGHNSTVNDMVFSKSTSKLFTTDEGGQIKKWDVPLTGLKSYVNAPLLGFFFQGAVNRIQFSSNRNQLVTADRYGGVTVWNPDNQFRTGRSFRLSSKMLTTASAIAPDGKSNATAMTEIGTNNAQILIWNVESGGVTRRLQGPVGSIRCIEYSPDGRILATAGENNQIWLWEGISGDKEWGRLEGHTDHVSALAFSPDGLTLLSGSTDKSVRIWTLPSTTNRDIAKISGLVLHTEFPDMLTSLKFMSDGKSALCSTSMGTQRWTIRNPKPSLDLPGAIVALSRDQKRIACASGTQLKSSARVFDAESGAEIARLENGHQKAISAIAFTPNGKYVLTAGRDFVVKCWDAETGNEVFDLNQLAAAVGGK